MTFETRASCTEQQPSWRSAFCNVIHLKWLRSTLSSRSQVKKKRMCGDTGRAQQTASPRNSSVAASPSFRPGKFQGRPVFLKLRFPSTWTPYILLAANVSFILAIKGPGTRAPVTLRDLKCRDRIYRLVARSVSVQRHAR